MSDTCILPVGRLAVVVVLVGKGTYINNQTLPPDKAASKQATDRRQSREQHKQEEELEKINKVNALSRDGTREWRVHCLSL